MRKLPKKVLMACDFSNTSLQLFSAIPDLLALGLKELLLVNIVKMGRAGTEDVNPIKQRFLEMTGKKIKELEDNGIKVKADVYLGTPSEEICRLAVQENCGMVAVGSSGEGSSVRSVLLGATAANVVRGCSVPVLVKKFKGEEGEAAAAKSLLDTVLVPVDFSTCSEAVLKWIYGKSHLIREVILVHVLDKPEDSREMAEEEEKAEIKLNRWSKKMADKGTETRVFMGKGIASQNILAEAQESEATLIALPRRGRGLVTGLIIGSTADAVVRRSSIPVLVFPF